MSIKEVQNIIECRVFITENDYARWSKKNPLYVELLSRAKVIKANEWTDWFKVNHTFWGKLKNYFKVEKKVVAESLEPAEVAKKLNLYHIGYGKYVKLGANKQAKMVAISKKGMLKAIGKNKENLQKQINSLCNIKEYKMNLTKIYNSIMEQEGKKEIVDSISPIIPLFGTCIYKIRNYK